MGSIWPQNDQKRWGTSQNIQNNGKLQNWSITMNCIDLRSKRSENPKLQTQSNNKQFASIWHQNDQNNAKLRKWSDYNALHRFDVKTIKIVELRRKTFKTTQNYKSDQITMNCIDLMSKRSKTLRYVAKLQKWSNYNELHRFDVKTIKTFELGRNTTKVIK